MKRILVILLTCFMLIPHQVFAEERKFNSLNLSGALQEEEIEPAYSNYTETDDQAIIYLFRGNGCGYCRAFLTFLNSIADEYGKYFKLVSFEVWYDADNAALLDTVSEYMGQDATGVPYIVIGDKIFAGFAESYEEDIKTAIKNLYDTNINERYDVFQKMSAEGVEIKASDASPSASGEGSSRTYNENSASSLGNFLVWDFLFTAVGVGIIILYDYKKHSEMANEIHELKDALKKGK